MEPNLVWEAALGELQLQMSRATFATWLQETRFLSFDDGVFVVGVKSEYARDWLENRLLATIERTLARLAGQEVGIRFEVLEKVAVAPADAEPIEVSEEAAVAPAGISVRGFVVPAYDVHEAGWFKVAEYECLFWAPYLGRVAWRVVEIVRETDRRGKRRTEWTPARRWTAPSLAELVPCGRQAIVGVDRACEVDHPAAFEVEEGIWRRHQAGAFDRLVAAAAATVERRGNPPRVTYWVSVRNQLGLLRPEQVAALAPRLQEKHDRWLADHGFDPREWDV